MNDHELWVVEAGRAMERRIAAAGAQPDFLDVVTRAHTMDPAVVTATMVEEADELAPVLDIRADQDRGPAEQEAALDKWLGDVRSAVERRVQAQREAPLPALPARRQRRMAWWAGGAVLAAGVLLALGLGQAVRAVAVDGHAPEQSLHQSGATGAEGVAVHPLGQQPAPRSLPRVKAPSPEQEAIIVPEPEPPRPETPPKATSRRPSQRDRLRALADEAQAHWRAGRRDEARRLFEKIVARGGRSRAAEMAYADLFTLAHQAQDRSAQRRYWSAYLKKFSRGRFADDAKAGLCRSASASRRGACWSAYLRDFPRGSFRGEARANAEESRP